MKSALRYLADAAPIWFFVDKLSSDALLGSARVSKTPWEKNGLRLHIFGNPTPKAREAVPGTDLPIRCPERHIQGDKTFCLGLRYIDVRCADDAVQWWEQLRQYLACQGVAALTRIWPPGHALDHGDAGKHHERALNLAAEAEVEEEYAAARLNESSWLTNPKLRLFDKKGNPINGRAVCPRGCQRRSRGRMVKTLRTDCPKRKVLVDLAFTEQKRRVALDDYWKLVFREGTRCCRTMRSCPLGDFEDNSLAQGGK